MTYTVIVWYNVSKEIMPTYLGTDIAGRSCPRSLNVGEFGMFGNFEFEGFLSVAGVGLLGFWICCSFAFGFAGLRIHEFGIVVLGLVSGGVFGFWVQGLSSLTLHTDLKHVDIGTIV